MTDLATTFTSHYRLITIVIFFFFASTLTVNLISLNAQHEPLPMPVVPEEHGKPAIPDPTPLTLQLKLPSGQISQLPLDTIIPPPLHPDTNTETKAAPPSKKDIRILISYIYTESPSSYTNLLFFLKHGLHPHADFMFVLNGKLDKQKYDYVNIWDNEKGDGTNLRVLEREKGTCFELGTLKEVLSKEEKSGKRVMDRYDRFIMLSSKVKGPFVEEGRRECWSELYLERLSDVVKMVGSKTLCPEPDFPYLPFTVWALGRTGLDILFKPTVIGNQCSKTEAEQEVNEKLITSMFLEEKHIESLSVLDEKSMRQPPDGGMLCGVIDTVPLTEKEIFEMMFVRYREDKLLEELSEKQWKSGFSSFDVCRKMTEMDMEIENK